MVVVPVTSTIHADTFATALGCEVKTPPLVQEKKDEWIFLTGVDPCVEPYVRRWREKGMKVCGYWIGSDSMMAVQDAQHRKNIPELDLHLCVHEEIQKELELWKVKSEVVYPCARNPSDILPEAPTRLVGIYMPEPFLYMLEECLLIAHQNPDLQFVFFGNEEPLDLPKNCQNAGRMTPEEAGKLQDSLSVLLRLCVHDGFPVAGIEMKMRGRHVIENYPYPGFLYAESLEDVTKFLQDPNTHKNDSSEWPKWYQENCSREAFKKNVMKYL